jgi:hypothetical protein
MVGALSADNSQRSLRPTRLGWLPVHPNRSHRMTRATSGNAPPLSILTDEETVTLRRVAFGESERRVLRREDLARLQHLRLIVEVNGELCLTGSGRAHFDTLPRPMLERPRTRAR